MRMFYVMVLIANGVAGMGCHRVPWHDISGILDWSYGVFKYILALGEEEQSFKTVGDAANTLPKPLFLDQIGFKDPNLKFSVEAIRILTNSENFDIIQPTTIKAKNGKPQMLQSGITADFVHVEALIRYPYFNRGANVTMKLRNLKAIMNIDVLAYQCSPLGWTNPFSYFCSIGTFIDLCAMGPSKFIFSRIGNVILDKLEVNFTAVGSDEKKSTIIEIKPVTFKGPDTNMVIKEPKNKDKFEFISSMHSIMLKSIIHVSKMDNYVGENFNKLLHVVLQTLFNLYVDSKSQMFNNVCPTSLNCHPPKWRYMGKEVNETKEKEDEKKKKQGGLRKDNT